MLRIKNLPAVRVKRTLCVVPVNPNFLTQVALSKNSTISLRHICRSPRDIQMMQCNQPLLNIDANSHLKGRSDQYPDTAVSNPPKQGSTLCFGFGFMDIGNFAFRNAQHNKPVFELIIDIEPWFRRGGIAEYGLNSTLVSCITVDVINSACTVLYL